MEKVVGKEHSRRLGVEFFACVHEGGLGFQVLACNGEFESKFMICSRSGVIARRGVL